MNKKSRNILIVSVGVAAIISFVSYLMYMNSYKASLEEWKNKIYNGITIGDIDVGGKNEVEAYNLVNDELIDKLDHKNIVLSVCGKTIRYEYKDFNIKYEIEKAVSEALNYGKDLSMHKQKKLMSSNSEKHDISLSMVVDSDKVSEVVDSLKKEVGQEPQNAKVNIVNDEVSIEEEKYGTTIDGSDLLDKINDSINCDILEDTTIEIDTTVEEPYIKASDLKGIKNKMSSFSTNYSSSASNRAYNVELATSLVDGTILMPGDTFSYSDVSQKGIGKYKDAPVYINNKVEQAEAGGICQVSTTLYRAVMRANIRSVERLNHSLPVGYAKLGLDATVAWGNIDYKFKNTYDFPIYIQGITDGANVIFNIYGDIDALDGKTYDMENEIIETVEPTVTYIDDPQLTIGTEVIDTYGSTGYRVKSYQITYVNGVETNREFVATDKYAATNTIVRRGTKPVEKQNNDSNSSNMNQNENNTQNGGNLDQNTGSDVQNQDNTGNPLNNSGVNNYTMR